MTAPDPRLNEIQALTDGLTDLCPEHLRQSIRHVQRNCDIDCNTHEDDYDACKQPDRYDGERMAAALASIPFLLAELRKAHEALARVEALHQPRQFNPISDGVYFGQSEFNHNICAYDHEHWPCPTAAAVAAAKGDGQ